jgi:molybdopterin-guanine dinucleotide biosynthesis protein A
MIEMPAVILAGGRATRMGGVDKALLPLGGGTVISVLLGRLAGQCGPVAVSANGEPARYGAFGLPVVADDLPGRGPLGGVLAGLDWAAARGAASVLTIPGDTPFVPRDLVARLGGAPAWAESSTGLHPLVAVWPVACRGALRAWLVSQPSGRVRRFGGQIGMRAVWFDDSPDPFHNINTPDDLDHARARLG